MPHWLSNPGTFGYGKSVFNAAYARSPVVSQNLAEAKKLVQAAGATGKTITIGTSSQLADISADAGAYQAAAQAIGLKAVLKSVSAQNYINFFIDPKARQGIDGFLTDNYGDYADPASMLATLVLPGGSQNYDNFNDPQIVSAMEQVAPEFPKTQFIAVSGNEGMPPNVMSIDWNNAQFGCQIGAGLVRCPVPAPPPVIAFADVVHHAPVGDKRGSPLSAVVLC